MQVIIPHPHPPLPLANLALTKKTEGMPKVVGSGTAARTGGGQGQPLGRGANPSGIYVRTYERK